MLPQKKIIFSLSLIVESLFNAAHGMKDDGPTLVSNLLHRSRSASDYCCLSNFSKKPTSTPLSKSFSDLRILKRCLGIEQKEEEIKNTEEKIVFELEFFDTDLSSDTETININSDAPAPKIVSEQEADTLGQLLIKAAMECNDIEVIRLIDQGASVDTITPWGNNAFFLVYAKINDYHKKNAAGNLSADIKKLETIYQILESRGANLKYIRNCSEQCCSPRSSQNCFSFRD